jgi:hypothetical protein
MGFDPSSIAYQDLLSSKGMEYLDRTYKRSFTLDIFIRNTEDLRQALDSLRDPMEHVKLLAARDEEAKRAILRNVVRLFHNFLAGAMTLVDHTRVFVQDHYLGTDVNKEFKSRIERDFSQNSLTRFVQDLRNYMLHCGLPPLERTLLITKEGHGASGDANFVTGFYLRSDDLKKWSGWKSDSKIYLESAGEQIDLLQLVESYRVIIYAFHSEFQNVLDAHHKNDLAQLDVLRDEFAAQQGSRDADRTDTLGAMNTEQPDRQ